MVVCFVVSCLIVTVFVLVVIVVVVVVVHFINFICELLCDCSDCFMFFFCESNAVAVGR